MKGPRHIYEVYIRTSPEKLWDAITNPEWNARYGYPGRSDYDPRAGGSFRAIASPEAHAMGMPEEVADGDVVEADPPRRLVQTSRFRAASSAWLIAEPQRNLTRGRLGRV